MSELFKLYKQDGTLVEVNEHSLSTALAIGWTEEKPKAEKKAEEKQVAKKKSKK